MSLRRDGRSWKARFLLSPTQASVLLQGKVLAGWEVFEYLGHGAFAHVFVTRNAAGRRAAIKILDIQADAEQQREFHNEGDLLAALAHATAVVDLVATGMEPVPMTIPGTTMTIPVPVRFHVLEYADDCLDKLLAYRHQLSWPDRLHLYRGAVLGVHQMHLTNVVHRDLKAANCLVFERPKMVVDAKVSDLGRARDHTRAPAAPPIAYLWGRGDPAFAAPELLWLQGAANRAAHVAADLYGVGSLLFEVATGQGLTVIALGPAVNYMTAAMPLSEADRAAEFSAVLPDIRSRFEIAFNLLAAEVDPVIRQPLLNVVRALCDPDPKRRGPRALPGRAPREPLLWTLDRVDSLIRTSSFAQAQARRFAKRKRA